MSNNDIGPAGQATSGQWADGITFACRNSMVSGNTITDATDGGIVIFGSPGSVVENNTITAATRDLLGGINMVDADGFGGDFSGTIVRSNLISSNGAFIHVGIAMGPYVWFCDARVNHGALVTGNTVTGSAVGYGYAVSGVSDWTVTGNVNTSSNNGISTAPCDSSRYSNALADAFVIDRTHAFGSFQPEFVDGVLEGAAGIRRWYKRRACC